MPTEVLPFAGWHEIRRCLWKLTCHEFITIKGQGEETSYEIGALSVKKKEANFIRHSTSDIGTLYQSRWSLVE